MAKECADDCLSLDVWKLNLTPGWAGSLTWRRGEREVGSIGYASHLPTGAVELSYTWRDRPVREWVWTERVSMRRGERLYWQCPGCNGRCQKLYLDAGRFRCRRCHDLAYASQQDRSERGNWLYAKRRVLEAEIDALRPNTTPRRLRRLVRESRAVTERLNANLMRFLAASDRTFARHGITLPPLTELAPPTMPAPKLPPGRPKEKRQYTRRRPLPTLSPATERTAYCVQCRDRRRVKWPRRVTLANGRLALAGRCATCGTSVRRIVAH